MFQTLARIMKKRFDKLLSAVKRNAVPLSYATATFLLFLIILEYLVTAQAGSIESQKKVEASNYASILKSKVDSELNSLLFISSGLSSYLTVYHKDIEKEKVEAILADLYARSKHIRNLAIAVGYRITYVFPTESNKQIIGVDYRNLPQQWPLVEKAVKTRRGVLAGPLDLIQGGHGLIYRYPIFIDNKYWGLLSTVIDTGHFFDAAFSDLSKQYDFAIRVQDPSGKVTQAFYGDDQLFHDRNSYLTTSAVPNAKWEWAVRDKTSYDLKFLLLIRFLVFGLSALLAYIVYLFLKERTTLASHAMYDSLTGLANRRFLYTRMDQALMQSQRLNQYLAIMFIDIDHFKKINDTHGHDFGDELLKTVAAKLLSCIRDVDTLSRIGGDEFIVVIEQLASKEDVKMIAQKILATFAHPMRILDSDIWISVSIGVSLYTPNTSRTIKSLMKEADIALYDVKASGRNNYKIYTE